MAGSTFGWAVIGDASAASKSWMRARSRSGDSAWGKPDSTRASVVPPCRMTWVLAGPLRGSWGPLGGAVPISAASLRVLTQRFR